MYICMGKHGWDWVSGSESLKMGLGFWFFISEDGSYFIYVDKPYYTVQDMIIEHVYSVYH